MEHKDIIWANSNDDNYDWDMDAWEVSHPKHISVDAQGYRNAH